MPLVMGTVESSALDEFMQRFRDLFPRGAGVRHCTHYRGWCWACSGRTPSAWRRCSHEATLEQLQQFLVDTPWDAGALDRQRRQLMVAARDRSEAAMRSSPTISGASIRPGLRMKTARPCRQRPPGATAPDGSPPALSSWHPTRG